jgi:hypothetical protein
MRESSFFLILLYFRMKRRSVFYGIIVAFLFLSIGCEKDDPNYGSLQLTSTKVGTQYLTVQGPNTGIQVDESILIAFSNSLDTNTVRNSILLTDDENNAILFEIDYLDNYKTIALTHGQNLSFLTDYTLQITSTLKGAGKETFEGVAYTFTTLGGTLEMTGITLNGLDFSTPARMSDVDRENIRIEITFSEELDASTYQSFIGLSGGVSLSYSLSADNKKVSVTNNHELAGFTRYFITISSNLTSKEGYTFNGFSNSFYTCVDSTLKFPEITDDELLDLVQKQTLRYFYDFAHPASGMSRERNTSGDIVTSGGTGFGVMALIVGMERGFITRTEGLGQLDKMLGFLETCDRFHGAWPHWMNGNSGAVIPFTEKDDGADLVETSFLLQGLLTMRQYLDAAVPSENNLIERINALFNETEFDWFTRGENVLYWHWSPDYNWSMNMPIRGHNEALIVYVLAASSASHGISASVYHNGYARNGGIVNGKSFYGVTLPLGEDYGGPLFFTHYSFLGLDPGNLRDTYAGYWEQNVNHTRINRAYCLDNPKNYVGYSSGSWGLTASDNQKGYSAHSPTNDLGVITPSAAVSALPYTPEESMEAIRYFYYILGDKLWGEYGFYDAFNITEQWWADSYIAIDQGPIICMIENYRSGLLWDLFMSCPEVQSGLDKLGFTY